jgi:hypothetical protein
MEVPRMCCFWRICLCVNDSKISDYKRTVLAANLDKRITRDIGKLMRPTSQKMKIFVTILEKMVSKDGPDS